MVITIFKQLKEDMSIRQKNINSEPNEVKKLIEDLETNTIITEEKQK